MYKKLVQTDHGYQSHQLLSDLDTYMRRYWSLFKVPPPLNNFRVTKAIIDNVKGYSSYCFENYETDHDFHTRTYRYIFQGVHIGGTLYFDSVFFFKKRIIRISQKMMFFKELYGLQKLSNSNTKMKPFDLMSISVFKS